MHTSSTLLVLVSHLQSLQQQEVEQEIFWIKAVCVVTKEGPKICELKNIAVTPSAQRQGYGRKLINYLINHYSKEYTQMMVGTGDVPGTLAFYKSCGFEYSHCIKDFFTENYDHPIIDNGVLLKDMIYLKRKIGF